MKIEFTTYCSNSPQVGSSVLSAETAVKSGWLTEEQYQDLLTGKEKKVVVEDDDNFRTYAKLQQEA